MKLIIVAILCAAGRFDKPIPNYILHSVLKASGDYWTEWRVKNDGVPPLLAQIKFNTPRSLLVFIYRHTFGPLDRLVFRLQIKALAQWSEL